MKIRNEKTVKNRKIQPHVPFKSTPAGDGWATASGRAGRQRALRSPWNPAQSPAVLFLKREWGWILRFSENVTIFTIFRKKYFGHKPLRDKRYGDGSATVETGRSVRFVFCTMNIDVEGV